MRDKSVTKKSSIWLYKKIELARLWLVILSSNMAAAANSTGPYPTRLLYFFRRGFLGGGAAFSKKNQKIKKVLVCVFPSPPCVLIKTICTHRTLAVRGSRLERPTDVLREDLHLSRKGRNVCWVIKVCILPINAVSVPIGKKNQEKTDLATCSPRIKPWRRSTSTSARRA